MYFPSKHARLGNSAAQAPQVQNATEPEFQGQAKDQTSEIREFHKARSVAGTIGC